MAVLMALLIMLLKEDPFLLVWWFAYRTRFVCHYLLMDLILIVFVYFSLLVGLLFKLAF